jgi:hypothetical protein
MRKGVGPGLYDSFSDIIRGIFFQLDNLALESFVSVISDKKRESRLNGGAIEMLERETFFVEALIAARDVFKDVGVKSVEKKLSSRDKKTVLDGVYAEICKLPIDEWLMDDFGVDTTKMDDDEYNELAREKHFLHTLKFAIVAYKEG